MKDAIVVVQVNVDNMKISNEKRELLEEMVLLRQEYKKLDKIAGNLARQLNNRMVIDAELELYSITDFFYNHLYRDQRKYVLPSCWL